MIASVGVCVSVRMGFASSTACKVDALSVGMSCPKKCGPSRGSLISIQLRECNYRTSFALGTVHVPESGGREASSDQSNTDASYLTHQHCGYEGQKLIKCIINKSASFPRWYWQGVGTRRSKRHVLVPIEQCVYEWSWHNGRCVVTALWKGGFTFTLCSAVRVLGNYISSVASVIYIYIYIYS